MRAGIPMTEQRAFEAEDDTEEAWSAPDFLADEGRVEVAAPAEDNSFPRFLSEAWDDDSPAVRPSLVPVQGGLPLLYAGESHLLFGQSGSGKSWLGYHMAAQVAADGGIALLIDRESNPRTIRTRLKALGVTRAQAGRIGYWKPSGSLMPGQPARRHLDTWLSRFHVELILLDSVSKDLAAAGFGENDPGEYVKWQQHVVEPWTGRRIASVLIDHVGHQAPQRIAMPRGASSKKDQISGSALYFRIVTQFSRASSGSAELVSIKDREGYRQDGEVAAVMHVEVADGGQQVGIRLSVPDARATSVIVSSPETQEDEYRELVAGLLRENDEAPLIGNQLAEKMKGLPGRFPPPASRALKWLVQEGYASASAPGLRGAIHYRLIKPYSSSSGRPGSSKAPAAGPGLEELF
ncbi:hypothetical protein GCM10009721_39240 [Terrabacter tumescens]|uniref:AAA domain-containing protein n=2 Tax=Terrabacter tumescens TaxID=60443 RepID=A0ABQ2IGI0_9MICO|nr:hypothetical protein GCM10009721_39240 [Terrabacter tumescens]